MLAKVVTGGLHGEQVSAFGKESIACHSFLVSLRLSPGNKQQAKKLVLESGKRFWADFVQTCPANLFSSESSRKEPLNVILKL